MDNSTTTSVSVPEEDDYYRSFSALVWQTFLEMEEFPPLFTTDASGLFVAYLDNLPDHRQHYNCNACKKFIEKFGGLVTIDEGGLAKPLFWHWKNVPIFFRDSAKAMHDIIIRSKITGVFICSDQVWGQPVTGKWKHLSVMPPEQYIFKSRIYTAYQVVSEKRENFKNIARFIDECDESTINRAVSLLKSEVLYRSEKCLGVAEWLQQLQADIRQCPYNRRNIIWRAVGSAPDGFCHPRSSMIGTLLEDLSDGFSVNECKRRFDAKMNPLKYQRPQVLPSKGNIKRAEEIVKKLGIENSLKRRFARFDEITPIWLPKPPDEKPDTGGVFDNIRYKGQREDRSYNGPSKTMTWEKFCRTVLIEAEKIEFLVPMARTYYAAIVTAEDMDAPPILRWDFPEKRNPLSHYLYTNGSDPRDWGLVARQYVDVTAICLQPSMSCAIDIGGKGAMFILDGARDYREPSLCLFPENMKSELREIRATIEEFSKRGKLGGFDEASACGILLQDGSNWNATFRVTSGGIQAKYKLDRWD